MDRWFLAMGTRIQVLTDDGGDRDAFDRAFDRVTAIFDREETRFSRFRDDSELTRVNRSAGVWTHVSPEFAEVLRRATAGAEETDGLFDPTVLEALTSAGYDRDFPSVRTDDRRLLRSVVCGRWREIEIDDAAVRLPRGVGIDLGGLVQGWTADLASEAALAAGLPWVAISAGGDLRLAGVAPALEIGIEEPEDRDEICCRIRIDDGAVATSSVTQRRWGRDRHHLIDPRIGRPASTLVLQATVWAPTCAEAEIASTRAVLEGTLATRDLTGVWMLATGEVVTNLTTTDAA
jgi:thiamine biosynthesis lipoprotein